MLPATIVAIVDCLRCALKILHWSKRGGRSLALFFQFCDDKVRNYMGLCERRENGCNAPCSCFSSVLGGHVVLEILSTSYSYPYSGEDMFCGCLGCIQVYLFFSDSLYHPCRCLTNMITVESCIAIPCALSPSHTLLQVVCSEASTLQRGTQAFISPRKHKVYSA